MSFMNKIPIFLFFSRKRCEYKWQKQNKHNFTKIGKHLFNFGKVDVGKDTYGELNVKQFEKNCNSLKIGNYCSIAPEVLFLMDGEHKHNSVSTYPFKARLFGELGDSFGKGDIIVDDDVWIGYGATIMSGVHIGQGAVIAAGAVVTKDVPPYAIVGGVPAKVIKYRFEPEMIEELLKIDYGKLSKEDIEKHIDDLYTELKAPSQLDWMPKKQSRDMGESRRE